MSTSMHNGGKWTDARFTSFIKGILRAGSNKWPPKWTVRSRSRQSRGVYLCAGYERKPHEVPASVRSKGKRQNNVYVDHITPIIGRGGFTSWDDFINGLYCEESNLQVLCLDCHSRKTKDEREKSKEIRMAKSLETEKPRLLEDMVQAESGEAQTICKDKLPKKQRKAKSRK